MTENLGRGEIVDERVVLKVPCQHCGETATMRLTPEQARTTASGLLAAADGLPRVETFEVRGEG